MMLNLWSVLMRLDVGGEAKKDEVNSSLLAFLLEREKRIEMDLVDLMVEVMALGSLRDI